MVNFFGYYGWLGCFIVGFLIGMLVAANNPTIAKWFSKKVDNAADDLKDKIDKVKKETKTKLKDGRK